MTETHYRILKNFSNPSADVIKEVCLDRGCTDDNWQEFVATEPSIHNPIRRLAAYTPFKAQLENLPQEGMILIYGDYDCDGITSSVIMHDLLLALGVAEERIHHFIPDRFKDGYGLTEKGWESAIKGHGDPALLITVDCGTPSGDLIKGFNFPTLVVDHHDFDNHGSGHPAKAHLNPKAENSEAARALQNCCAAGLAFLLAEAIAQDLSIQGWNRNRALILGGMATLVDVMKLLGVNRAMVKHSLRLANLSSLSDSVPGLAALKKAAETKRVDADAYGFQWGPRINACGRLMEASPALNLLLAKDESTAVTVSQQIEAFFQGLKGVEIAQDDAAKALSAVNEARKQVQKEVVKEAMAQADEKLKQEPKPKALVLYNEAWHAGVIGIVAARVREATHRPTIVLGKQPEPEGPWKGSGRSIPEYDLGSGIRAAADQKILLGGGGHPMAAGMSAESEAKIAELQRFMNTHCTLDDSDFTPAFEILGPMDAQPAKEWWEILEQLQPFGQGHAPLYFTFKQATLREIRESGDSGEWSLLKIQFNGGDHRIKAAAAQAQSLTCGDTISGVVSLSQTVYNASNIFYNWTLKAFKRK